MDIEDDEEQGGRNTLKFPVTSWIHVILIIVTIISCYFGLSSSITSAVAQTAKNTTDITVIQGAIQGIEMSNQKMEDDLTYFHKQYDQDMNKYIRSPHDQH